MTITDSNHTVYFLVMNICILKLQNTLRFISTICFKVKVLYRKRSTGRKKRNKMKSNEINSKKKNEMEAN